MPTSFLGFRPGSRSRPPACPAPAYPPAATVAVMGLFRRGASPADDRGAQDAAVADFWAWWAADGAGRAARLFDGGGSPEELEALAQDVGARVEAIGPLAFETGAGRSARHVLVLTAAGDPDLREVTRRWLAAAPAADDAFEYAIWRQPVPEAGALVIEYGEWPVALGEAAARLVVDDGRVHVEVFHPRFAQMPDDDRGQVTFLFLDALIGEQAVEELVGEVAWSTTRPDDAVALTELPAVVQRLGGRGSGVPAIAAPDPAPHVPLPP